MWWTDSPNILSEGKAIQSQTSGLKMVQALFLQAQSPQETQPVMKYAPCCGLWKMAVKLCSNKIHISSQLVVTASLHRLTVKWLLLLKNTNMQRAFSSAPEWRRHHRPLPGCPPDGSSCDNRGNSAVISAYESPAKNTATSRFELLQLIIQLIDSFRVSTLLAGWQDEYPTCENTSATHRHFFRCRHSPGVLSLHSRWQEDDLLTSRI